MYRVSLNDALALVAFSLQCILVVNKKQETHILNGKLVACIFFHQVAKYQAAASRIMLQVHAHRHNPIVTGD